MRIPRSHRRFRAPAALAILAMTAVPAAPAAAASHHLSSHEKHAHHQHHHHRAHKKKQVTRRAKKATIRLSKKQKASAKACYLAHHRKHKRDIRRCHKLRHSVAKMTAAHEARVAEHRAASWRQHHHHDTTPPTTTTTTSSGSTTTTTTTTTTTPTSPTSGSTPTDTGGTATGASTSSSSRLYADNSPFNTKIPANPAIAPNSSAMVSKSLLPYAGGANFANSDGWGISMVHASSSDPMRVVGLAPGGYGPTDFPAFPIPNGAQPTQGSDHHLVVFSGDQELDMWVANEASDGSWTAGARAISSTTGNGIAGPVSGNAAGFDLAAGVIRPEEIAAGRIDHALVFTSPYIHNSFVAPAVHGDGRQSDPDAMPMGTRIQLDPSVDISGLPRYKRIVAQALKDYGAYLVDSSGSLAIRGEASIGRASQGGPSDIWSPVGVTDSSLSGLPWSQMRVIAP